MARHREKERFEKGDRVRVLVAANPLHEGKIGTVVNQPAIAANPILRVRLDRFDEGVHEVDGTADKFEKLDEAEPPSLSVRPSDAARIVQLLQRIESVESYKRGSWGLVIEAARNYAMMHSFGKYRDGETLCTVCDSDRKIFAEQFRDQMLRAAVDALAEELQPPPE